MQIILVWIKVLRLLPEANLFKQQSHSITAYTCSWSLHTRDKYLPLPVPVTVCRVVMFWLLSFSERSNSGNDIGSASATQGRTNAVVPRDAGKYKHVAKKSASTCIPKLSLKKEQKKNTAKEKQKHWFYIQWRALKIIQKRPICIAKVK